MLNYQNVNFWLTKVTFVGHVIFKGGIKVDPQKVKTVTEWTRLANFAEVRSFSVMSSTIGDLYEIF